MTAQDFTIAQNILRLVDPHECTDMKETRSVHEAIFDSLVTRDRNLNYHPGLAKSWDVSPDARSWQFRLQEGVQFHNGEPFDAEAVKYSIERMTRPDIGAALGASAVYAQYLEGVKVSVLDPHTVRVTTVAPLADLLDILVDGYLLPPRATEAAGTDFKSHPIGTGAYRFVEWVPGERIVAEAYPDHFRGQPRIAKVTWQLVPDRADRIELLRSKQADIITDLEPSDEHQLADLPDGEILKSRNTTSVVFFLNSSQGVLQDVRLRQAINLAVDKEQIISRVLDGAGYPLSSFVGPGHLGYDPAQPPYQPDPGKVQSLLKAAGFENGLELDLMTPTSFPAEAEALSAEIVSQLEALGIETRIHTVTDRTEYANMVRRKEIRDLCCFDSSPLSTYRVLKEKMSSTFTGAWWQGYSNSEVNRLIEQGSQTPDDRARHEIYKRCFRLIHEEAPWLFLYDPQFIFGYQGWLGGWQPREDGCIILRMI